MGDGATKDVIEERAEEALRTAAALGGKQTYRVASVVTHDPEIEKGD